MSKKSVHKILLVIAVFIALLLNQDFQLLSIATTLALIFGFINIYFTVNRSKYFIYADLLWIIFSVITLLITNNYSDVWLYIFYFFVGFYQYFNWKNNENDENEFEIIYPSEAKTETFSWLLLGFVIMIAIILLDFLSGLNSNNLILGASISGFGIVASIMLARRQYFSEVIYAFVNFFQIVLYLLSGLFSLALIPLIFWIFTLMFLVENRKKNEQEKKELRLADGYGNLAKEMSKTSQSIDKKE